ncbi:hypothetical protein N7495_001807 [Penicillium taxi]|uniref:uncharacterized protein n=1 Tax=Penicillium taxi TaxID=168475 RepID=UPI002545BA68|nr:uncharacterized protein N7495_001807 [Penicillium taxi]KAJ5909125.1 hypothetical protein N7495_001807 [Penicillium taxi]
MHLKENLVDPTKFRILMIHGFAGSAEDFRAKSSPISARINELVTPEILSEFPGGIEFLYIDAPWMLEAPIGTLPEETDKSNIQLRAQDDPETALLGWWYGRDTVSKYRGIEVSLSHVAQYIYGRPIHAIVSYSQGSALAGMVCSLLECHDNPDKISAIRAQGLPVDDFLHLPGQKPLRFFIGVAGYCGEYFWSLYRWPLQTPSLHTLATFDAVVEHFQTMDLAHCFNYYEIVRYYGSHFTPRDRATVESLAQFALRNASIQTDSPLSSRFPRAATMTSVSDSDECGSDSSRSASSRLGLTVPVWSRSKRVNVTLSRRRRLASSRSVPAFH